MGDELLGNAAGAGDDVGVRKLLALGADPDHDPLQSPLQRAVFFGHASTATTLLDAGAAVDAGEVDEAGMSFWGSMVASGSIAGHLPVNDPLGGGTRVDDEHRRWSVTPLAVAIAQRNSPMIDLLLARGADPNRTVLGGLTPLDLAAIDCNFDATRTLLDHGATARSRPVELACAAEEVQAPR